MLVNLWTGKGRALRQIDAIGAVICLAASLAVYFTALNPLIKQRSFLADQRNELMIQHDESLRLSALTLTLGNQLAEAQKEFAQHEIRLESSDRTNQRLAALTSLFTDYSLAVDDIQAGKISAGPTWDLVPISITGRGQYAKCTALLDTLRQTFVDMNMARLRLEGNPVQSEELSRFRFQFLWHTTPKAQAVGKQ
jgi:Tfp pilus assembly protein PilO